MKRIKVGFLGLLFIVSLPSPGIPKIPGASPSYAPPSAQASPWPTAGWKTSTPEEQGMDSRKLAGALDFLKTYEPNIHSLLVVRNGVLVAEAYFHPFPPESRHDVASVTKSVTSTLVGIAVRKGLIKSVEEPVLGFFPEYAPANLDDRKKSITLRDLLAMRSGLQCVASPTEETLMRMIASPDWIRFMLDLPMAAKPGEVFVYNSGGVHLLSAVIRKATGRSALDFAKDELFGPLGITDARWPADPLRGDNHGWGDLQLRPRDLAKIGYLFLNKGAWDGKTIVTPEWVAAATSPFPGALQDNYGRLWWLNKDYGYSARGRGGQYIYVVPRTNLVVVMTGGGLRAADRTLTGHILPAVVSPSAPLPGDPDGAALLRSRIEEAARAPQPSPGTERLRPETAAKISGREIKFDSNPFDISVMKLDFDAAGDAVMSVRAPGFGAKDQTFQLGFGGTFRYSEGRNGMAVAGKGTWTSPQSVSIEIDEIGNINKFLVELTFDETGATGFIEEKTGLGRAPLRGSFVRK